jgi:uncharacterized membrane protein YbhN (UPF0104 family)
MSKKIIKWILQLAATILLLYLALSKIELGRLWEIILKMDYHPFLLIPVLLFVDLLINSYRIVSLYRFYGVATQLFKVVGIKWQGMFFSLIFPFLGDAYKIQSFKTAYGSSYWKNTMVVLLDRLIYTFGLTIVLVPILLFSVFNISLFITFIVVALLLFEILLLVILNQPLVFKNLQELLIKIHPFFSKINIHFDKRKGYAKEITFNTFAAVSRHILIAFTYLLVGWALMGSFQFNIPGFFAVVFFIMLSRVIPVSVGGIGLREYIAVVVFPQIGIGSDYAFSIAFVISSIMVFQGIAGGLYYLGNKIRKKPV